MIGSRYGELHRAHQRIGKEIEARRAGAEITDGKVERQARDASRTARTATPTRATVNARAEARGATPALANQEAAKAAAGARRPEAGSKQATVIEGPAPGETLRHYEWRRINTRRIERERARDAAAAKGNNQGAGKTADWPPEARDPAKAREKGDEKSKDKKSDASVDVEPET